MKRIVLPLFVCLLPALAFGVTPPPAGISFIQTTIEDGLQMASAKNKRVFVHFTASWCMPCRWMEDNTFQDPHLASYLSEQFISIRLDVDQYIGFREKEAYQVHTLPTTLVLDASGTVLLRLEGTIDAWDLRTRMRGLPHSPTASPPTGEAAPAAAFSHLRKERLVPTTTPAAPAAAPSYQPSPPALSEYGIEVALFSNYDRAIPYVSRLERQLTAPVAIIVNDQDFDKIIYRIVVGRFSEPAAANQLRDRLAQTGLTGVVKELSSL